MTGQTGHADSALIRHFLVLAIEVSLFAFISLSKITHSDLTFVQSFWLSLTHCVLLGSCLACEAPSMCAKCCEAALLGMAWTRHAINIQDHTVQSNTE